MQTNLPENQAIIKIKNIDTHLSTRSLIFGGVVYAKNHICREIYSVWLVYNLIKTCITLLKCLNKK